MRDSPEFRRIRSLIEAAGALPGQEVLLGPGDDAALLTPGDDEVLAVSTDLSVEHVHFRRGWLGWESIGWRAVAAALSDLAAMAVRPIGALVSLAVPPEVDDRTLGELAGGMGSCLRHYEAALLGGDLSASPGPVVIDVTVIGSGSEPVSRSGARIGDELWVTGSLGGAARAARAWAAGGEPELSAKRAFERPTPRVREAQLLSSVADVHALIDLSDGLAADAAQMAAASSVQLKLEAGRVPVHAALRDHADSDVALAIAVGGGEDYELLAAVAPGTADMAVRELARLHDVRLTRVGSVREGVGVKWIGREGEAVEPPSRGFDHFGMEG